MIKKIYKSILSEKTRIRLRTSLQKCSSIYYRGNNYYCNCCSKSFRTFLPKGNIQRKQAKCPYCSSLERTRVLDLYLEKELDIYKHEASSILHFAPEAILFEKLKNINSVEYVDGDINTAYARNIVDATDIKYPDNYFDYIICSHVLGHVPDEPKAIREMYRVLKNDGVALIMTLLSDAKHTLEKDSIQSPDDRLKHYGELDLCRLHAHDFEDRIKAQGFKTQKIDYRTNFSSEIRKKQSLGDGSREIIFSCRK